MKYIWTLISLFLILVLSSCVNEQVNNDEKVVEKEMDVMLTSGNIVEGNYAFHDLPYSADALEPFIDRKIMSLHYDKHHKGYYTKFIKSIKDTEFWNIGLVEIFSRMDEFDDAVRNNAGGYYNHWLFWNSLSPNKTEMSDELILGFEEDFVSVEAFKEAFSQAALSQFGSGWAWLILTDDNSLAISQTPNQDNPLMNVSEVQGIPILAIDVWEHAYYLQYENRRDEYVTNFWNIIDWEKVSERYEDALNNEIYLP
jgi:superoxide dismutase, Fe-Mn family